MRQYHAIKQQVPNALLMFRLGDFYELFYEDAVTAARELEITLTSRNKEKGQAIPMCGVPYHAADGYLARLIQKGYRVAVCDQMEEAGPGQEAGEARSDARGDAGDGDRIVAAAVAREQLSGGGVPQRHAGRHRARRHFDGRVSRDGTGCVRSERGAREPECARSVGSGIGRPMCRACEPRSRTGSSAWITPIARCANIFVC